jgi:hypothetical protein
MSSLVARPRRPGKGGSAEPAAAFKVAVRAADLDLMRSRLLGWTLACLLAGLPAPLAAEIYRWTDAGGDHFTTDLSKVPRQHRPAARQSATPERPPEPIIEAPAVSVPLPLAPQSRPAAPAPDPLGSDACHEARKRIRGLRRTLASAERQAEAAEDSAGNIRLSNSSRAHHRARAQRYEAKVQDAQEAVDDYENLMRQRGLPRGCLR